MKHITLAAVLLLGALTSSAQVDIDSEFSDWTGAIPDGWFGSKTNLAASGVEPVVEANDTIGVRLINASTSHKRFSTTAQTVTSGEAYDITFWVRGQGDIRTGVFDERTTGSGYSPYNPYVTVNTSTWESHTQTVSIANSSALAEFIISVNNTAATGIEIDRVTIVTGTVVPPTAATIAEIQESTAPDGASPLVGTVVATQGTVSALNGTSGFFLQDGTGPWTGIYVFNAPGTLAIGDAITLTGTVAEFNGQTQLTGLSSLNVVSSGNALPATLISTAAGNTEPYESVLAVVAPATCTAQGSFGQYTVNDGGGTLLVDDVIYAHPFVVGTTYSITGVVQYAFNEWRMLPRFAADVELYNSVTDLNGTVLRSYPNPAMDLFTIELQRTAVRTELRMIDANGRLVRSELITGDRAILDVSGMAEGLYTVSLMLDNGAEHVRVMVQH
jgi:hypothetical protein